MKHYKNSPSLLQEAVLSFLYLCLLAEHMKSIALVDLETIL